MRLAVVVALTEPTTQRTAQQLIPVVTQLLVVLTVWLVALQQTQTGDVGPGHVVTPQFPAAVPAALREDRTETAQPFVVVVRQPTMLHLAAQVATSAEARLQTITITNITSE